VIGPDNKAVTNEAVYVSAGNSQAVKLTTGTNGKASFSFDTALWKDKVNLQVGYCSIMNSVQELPIYNQFSIDQLYNPYLVKETFHPIDHVGGEQDGRRLFFN